MNPIARLKARWSLHKQCVALLRDLPIPMPFNIQVFCAAVAASLGCPIELRPVAIKGRATGWIEETPTGIIIYYQRDTSPFHQERIILHELSHVLLGHLSPSSQDTSLTEKYLPDVPRYLLHSLRRRWTRGGESIPEDDAAEYLALLIRQHVVTRPRAEGWTRNPEANDILGQIVEFYEHRGIR